MKVVPYSNQSDFFFQNARIPHKVQGENMEDMEQIGLPKIEG